MTKVPWYCICLLVSSSCIIMGLEWDISWHETIGRDTLFAPPHLFIYLGAVIAGCASGWLVLKTTFGNEPKLKAESVGMWGFRGPLAGWVCIWGAIAMLTSAPFDDWWHNAYGLDVEILSPPHAVLGLGFSAIFAGAIYSVLALQNRSDTSMHKTYGILHAYATGVGLTGLVTFFMNNNTANNQHNLSFYAVSAVAYSWVMVSNGRASKLRWPMTWAAGFFLLHRCGAVWVLPLFEGSPRLAPIYRPITHFIAPPFPILLIVPALGMDVILAAYKDHSKQIHEWLRSAALGICYTGLLFVTQWHFSKILISESARGWFFGYGMFPFWSAPGPWEFQFFNARPDSVTFAGLAIVAVMATLACRFGLVLGNWLSRVQR